VSARAASPHDTIDQFFEQAQISHKRASENTWVAELRGERKLSIPVTMTIAGDRLTIESFFMRRPQENKDQFYEMLLRRNARAYGVHFALDTTGDVYLVGQRSTTGLDVDELDRIAGAILTEADGMFDAAIRIGFAAYLEADMAWRARQP
jgi:hypothetical protein